MRHFARFRVVLVLFGCSLPFFSGYTQEPSEPTAEDNGSEGVSAVVREEVDTWYDWALKYSVRPGVLAIVGGMIVALVVPQRVKMDFPVSWPSDVRKRRTRLTSFVSGFATTFLLWPMFWPWSHMQGMDIYGVLVGGFIMSILVGAAAPFTYTIVMNFAYKRGWVDENVWSGEMRAAVRRTTGGRPIYVFKEGETPPPPTPIDPVRPPQQPPTGGGN